MQFGFAVSGCLYRWVDDVADQLLDFPLRLELLHLCRNVSRHNCLRASTGFSVHCNVPRAIASPLSGVADEYVTSEEFYVDALSNSDAYKLVTNVSTGS